MLRFSQLILSEPRPIEGIRRKIFCRLVNSYVILCVIMGYYSLLNGKGRPLIQNDSFKSDSYAIFRHHIRYAGAFSSK